MFSYVLNARIIDSVDLSFKFSAEDRSDAEAEELAIWLIEPYVELLDGSAILSVDNNQICELSQIQLSERCEDKVLYPAPDFNFLISLFRW